MIALKSYLKEFEIVYLNKLSCTGSKLYLAVISKLLNQISVCASTSRMNYSQSKCLFNSLVRRWKIHEKTKRPENSSKSVIEYSYLVPPAKSPQPTVEKTSKIQQYEKIMFFLIYCTSNIELFFRSQGRLSSFHSFLSPMYTHRQTK